MIEPSGYACVAVKHLKNRLSRVRCCHFASGRAVGTVLERAGRVGRVVRLQLRVGNDAPAVILKNLERVFVPGGIRRALAPQAGDPPQPPRISRSGGVLVRSRKRHRICCLRKKNTMTDEVSDATRLARRIFDGL